MDILTFLGAVPKIALFFLLIVGGAIVAEIAYFTKKKWPGNGPNLLSQEPVTQKLPETSVTMPPPPKLTTEEVLPSKKPRLNKKIVTTALIFLTLAVSIPATVLLVKQRQEIRKGAQCAPDCSGVANICAGVTYPDGCGGNCTGTKYGDGCPPAPCVPDCSGVGNICAGVTYPDGCGGNCTGTKEGGGCPTSPPISTPTPVPTPTPSACTPTVNFTGDAACVSGADSLSVTIEACLPAGCPQTTINYSGGSATCPGSSKASCSGPCPVNTTSRQLTIQGGSCATATVTCTTPACGSCQVDLAYGGQTHGAIAWKDSCTSASPTPTPTSAMSCTLIKAYDLTWNQITNLTTLTSGRTIYLANTGTTTDTAGLTKSRFRINSGAWQETTTKHGNEFYIQYTIPAAGTFQVESMVYNPTLGWY